MRYDIAQISGLLSQRAESVCKWLLPQGKREGYEWRVGSVDGEQGHSMAVNIGTKAGLWTDFASSDKGGDLIDLIQHVLKLDKKGAVKEAKDFLGIKDESTEFIHPTKKYSFPQRPEGLKAPSEEMVEWFKARGISHETLKKFNIGEIENSKFGKVIVFPYIRDGKLIFIKFRPLHDKHSMWTSKNSEPCLFGWQNMPNDSKYAVIVEGEIDALSYAEKGYNALSVPRGGGSNGKQDGWIESEWDNLQLFHKIYLSLDMDSQGQEAKEYIARRLGSHRCYNIELPCKDANEALLSNVNFETIFKSSKTIDPDELRPAVDYMDSIFEYMYDDRGLVGETLPWRKVDNILRIRNGETTIWAGINGHGKSQMVGHHVVHSMANGGRWCIASMEFKPHKLLARMVRQILGKNKPEGTDKRALEEFFDNLWIFDVQGTAKPKRILEVFEYAFKRYGITHFLIDSLAKCGFNEDGYNEQKKFVDELSDFARDNNIQMHLVCHSRKRENEENVPDKFDIKGTGAITDMVDNVYIVWRNKQKEKILQNLDKKSEKYKEAVKDSDAILYCCKQREGEWEGSVSLWFDRASLQYLEASNKKPIRYCAGEEK